MVLGPRVIDRFQTQKTGSLLAYVAMHPEKTFARDVVAAMLWPDGDLQAVRNRLNQAVSSLRRQVHSTDRAADAVLVADHQTIRINPHNVSTDYAEFLSHIEAARASQCVKDSMGAYESAVALYKGELLAGYQDTWITLERIHLADLYQIALQSVIRASANLGDLDKAIHHAALRVRDAPQNEKAHRTLMRLYMHAGRAQSSLAQFEQLKQILATSGQSPSARSNEIYEIALGQLNVREPTRRAPKYAVVAEPAAPTYAPQRPNRPAKVQLPNFASRFYGREEELGRILELLGSDSMQVIILTGLSGVGKSRLAAEASRRFAEADTHGIALVDFSRIRPEEDAVQWIADTVLHAVPEPDRRRDGLMSWLAEFQPCYLVLDNLDAATSDHIDQIQQFITEHGVGVIGTAQVHIGFEGERDLQIAPLSIRGLDANADVTDLIQVPALALFVARSQGVRHDFQITQRNKESIVDLLRALDGIPLAIELAATWARTLTPKQLLDRIKADQYELKQRRPSVSHRHASLALAINSSLQFLAPETRRALERLSVFVGAFTLDLAIEVLHEPQLPDYLRELADHALVQTVEDGDQLRFRVLDIVRRLVWHSLDAKVRDELSAAHADTFDRLACAAPYFSYEMIKIFGQWRHEINKAIDWRLHQGQYQLALESICRLLAFRLLQRRPQSAAEFGEHILRSIPAEELDTVAGLRAQKRTGRAYVELGKLDEAQRWLQPISAKMLASDDPQLVAEYYLTQASIAMRKFELNQTVELLLRAYELAPRLSPGVISRITLSLGNASVDLGHLDEASSWNSEALKISRMTGDPMQAALALGNLALTRRLQTRYEEALALVNEAMHNEFARENGWMGRTLLSTWALIRIRMGYADEAIERMLVESQDPNQSTFTRIVRLIVVAAAMESLGCDAEALTLLSIALKYDQSESRLVGPLWDGLIDEVRDRACLKVGPRVAEHRWQLGSGMDFEGAERLIQETRLEDPIDVSPLSVQPANGR
ncbi:MAG: hypothetical protein JNM85_02850 [Chthonomonas sp.]|nr:hypothetical protein [Chthonomonas sp.]